MSNIYLPIFKERCPVSNTPISVENNYVTIKSLKTKMCFAIKV